MDLEKLKKEADVHVISKEITEDQRHFQRGI